MRFPALSGAVKSQNVLSLAAECLFNLAQQHIHTYIHTYIQHVFILIFEEKRLPCSKTAGNCLKHYCALKCYLQTPKNTLS